MRGVDECVHSLRTQPPGEPFRPAESPDAYVPFERPRPGHPARERGGHAHAGPGGEGRGEFAGLGRAAQDQDMGMGMGMGVRGHGVERTGHTNQPRVRATGINASGISKAPGSAEQKLRPAHHRRRDHQPLEEPLVDAVHGELADHGTRDDEGGEGGVQQQ